MKERIDLVRDVLDEQLIDRAETKMGRIDGFVLVLDEETGQPRIEHLELGFVVLARRIHPALERGLEWLRRRWSVRECARQIVPWSKVMDMASYHVQLDLDAEKTPAFDWEHWLRDHVVKKIPGAGDE